MNAPIINKKIRLLPGIILALIMVSCESDKRPEPIVPVLPDVVSFKDHIEPIFEGKSIGIDQTGRGDACTKCHNGATPPDLTAENAYIELTGGGYTNTDSPESSKLYEAVKPGGSMNQHTNEVDVAYILEWINEGVQDN
jgi:hypothetical protein